MGEKANLFGDMLDLLIQSKHQQSTHFSKCRLRCSLGKDVVLVVRLILNGSELVCVGAGKLFGSKRERLRPANDWSCSKSPAEATLICTCYLKLTNVYLRLSLEWHKRRPLSTQQVPSMTSRSSFKFQVRSANFAQTTPNLGGQTVCVAESRQCIAVRSTKTSR